MVSEMTSYFSDLVVDGSDAFALLQGQLTQDLGAVSETQGSLAACCDLKGRVVFLGYVRQEAKAYHLTVPALQAKAFLSRLRYYAAFSTVTFSIVSPPRVGVCGPKASEFLSAFGLPVPERVNQICRQNKSSVIKRHGAIPRFEILNFTEFAQGILGTMEDWLVAQLLAKEPWVDASNSGLFLPHELSLVELGAVSFQKGCYLGQEIIARMEHLGKTKKHLLLEQFPADTLLTVGEEFLQNGQVVCFFRGEKALTALLLKKR